MEDLVKWVRWGLLFSSILFCEFQIWGRKVRERKRGREQRKKQKKEGVAFLLWLLLISLSFCVVFHSIKLNTDLFILLVS